MRSNLLMNYLWYEDISPDDLAKVLNIPPETLFRKIFQEEDFTEEEIRKIVGLLGLNDDETRLITELAETGDTDSSLRAE